MGRSTISTAERPVIFTTGEKDDRLLGTLRTEHAAVLRSNWAPPVSAGDIQAGDIFNKQSVMALPAVVNKATDLRRRLPNWGSARSTRSASATRRTISVP